MRALLLAWSILLAGIVPSRAFAQSLTYGPILGRGASPDQMILKWGTSTNSSTAVWYRPIGTAAFRAASGAPGVDHEVVLSGLESGTTFDYVVGSGAVYSSYSTFSTCPEPGAPLDVVVYGDSRSDSVEHAKVVQHIVDLQPDLVLQSGDLVLDGSYASYLSEFFPAVAKMVATTPYMAAPGNHDASSTLSTNFGRVFPSPRADASAPWKSYYGFRCGNARFIALDSNAVDDSQQQSFLSAQLGTARDDATTDHVFVFFHHSPYSTGAHGDNAEVQARWVPLFSDPRNKVSAVFTGHDHDYERLSNRSQATYVVSGGAGAGLGYEVGGSSAHSILYKAVHHFVRLHIVGATASATVLDDEGVAFDSFTVDRTGAAGAGKADGTVVAKQDSAGCTFEPGPQPGSSALALFCLVAVLAVTRVRIRR